MSADNVKKGKINKRRRSVGHGYAGNFLRSLGYSARDVISDVMPNTRDLVSDAKEAKMELDDALHMAAQKTKDVSTSAKSKLQELKENELKDMLEDIKSGKLYNKDRIKDAFGDFDLGGFGDFDEDFDSGFDGGDTNLSFDLDIPEDSPIVESQDMTTATVTKSAELLVKEGRSNSITVSSSIAKMGSGLGTALQLLHEDITTLTTTIPKSLTEHAALSAKYYEDSIGYQQKISESLDELKTMYAGSRKLMGSTAEKEESRLDKLVGLGLGSYKDLVKGQAKSTIMGNTAVSLASSMLEMYRMSQQMGDSKGLAASGTNMILKALLGKGIKKSAGKVDSFLENLMLPVAMKMGKWQDAWDSPFKQFIGNIFGVKAAPDLSVDKSKYEKGAVAFDGKVHRAITDVIPTYLRMITSALTGKEEIAFDYEKGVYNTVSNIQKKFDKNIKESVTNEYFSEQLDFGRIVDKLEGISEKQGEQIKDAFSDFLFNMAKTNDLVTFRKNGEKDDIAKLTGRSSDDPIVQIIRDYFEGMYNQGRHTELNEIFGRKSLSAKRNLEETMRKLSTDATSSNYYLINNGLNSSKHSTAWEKDETDKQIDRILETYDKDSAVYKDAEKLKKQRLAQGLYGKSKAANTISPANTGNGIGIDKYNRSSSSYLREILGTLATGIRVVNVGTVQGGTGGIIAHSNKVLRSLQLDDATYNMSSAGNAASSNEDIDNILYDSEKALDVFASILNETRDEDDALNWLAKKFGNKNVVGRAATSLKSKRDALNKKADNIANRITGTGIDFIYGKRESSTQNEETDEFGTSQTPPPTSPNGVDPDSASATMPASAGNQLARQFSQIGSMFEQRVIDPLQNALFDEEDGFVTQVEDMGNGEGSDLDKQTEAVEDIAKKTGKVAANKAKNTFLGEKDEETGNYINGIFSEEANAAAVAKTNVSNWTHELIYGSKDGKEKGLLSSIRSFFGETEDGKLDISGKAAGAGRTLKDHFVSRAHEWTDLIFGKSEEGEEDKLDIFLGDMKGKKGQIAGAATVGVLGSFFLPGGPITGALIGAGMSIVKNSNQLKDALFGEQDENGERSGAIITKEVQAFFKENGHSLKVGAGVGVLGSFFLPGGPITGALIGSGVALAAKSEAFSDLMYGEGGTKEDPTGGITKYIKEHYSKDKDMKATFLDAGIGAGVGVLGSFFLPGGPITGALIGAAANISVNSDKFKDWFFGKEDPETNKREGGVFGDVKKRTITFLQKTQEDLGLWIYDNITAPLKASMEPIKKRAKTFLFGKDEDEENKGLIGALAKRLDNSVFGDLKKAVKKNIVDKMKNGFQKIFGGFTHLVGEIIKSPVLALQAIAADMDDDKENGKVSLTKRIEDLRKDHRAKLAEKKQKKSSSNPLLTTEEQSANTEETASEPKAKETPEEVTAEATTNTEKIVQEQLDTTKEQHTEKVSILQKILDKMPFGGKKKKGDTAGAVDEEEAPEETAKVTTNPVRLTGDSPVERIDRNVEKFTKTTEDQLDDVGYTTNRIYKLLRKRLKYDDEDDEDGDAVGERRGGRHRGFLRRFHPIRSLKRKAVSAKDFIKGKIGDGIKALLGVPKKLLTFAFSAVKKLGQGIASVAEGIYKVGKKVLPAAIHGLVKVAEATVSAASWVGKHLLGAVKEFGKAVAWTGKQLWGIGKEAVKTVWGVTKEIGKTAWGITKEIGGLAWGLAKGVGRTAWGAVKGVGGTIGRKIFKKSADQKITRFVISGGHLDYVTEVKYIGKKKNGVVAEEEAEQGVVSTRGDVESFISEDSAIAAASGGVNHPFRSFKDAAKSKLSSLSTKAKGSIGAIKAKFAKEDSEKEQASWRNKIAELLKKNTEGNEKHHLSWGSIFSKKGLITAGLVLMAPFLLKAVKGIIKFFQSGIGESIASTLSSLAKWITKAFGDEGGVGGMVNNASENVNQIGVGLGLKEGEQYAIDENTGAIKTDENGNLIKESTGKKGFSLKNLFYGKKAHIDTETGEVTNEATYDHTTQMLHTAGKFATYKAVDVTGKAVNFGKKVSGSKVGQWAGKKLGAVATSTKGAVVNGAKTIGNSKLAQKVVQSEAGQATKGIFGTAKKFLKKGLDFVIEKFGKLLSKFGVSGSGMSKLTQKVAKLSSSLWDDTLLKKFSPTIQKLLAKMGISTGSALIAEVAFVGIGALSGATNPGELFEVNMDDVENAKTKAVMIAISTVYQGIMGSSFGSWFDLACDIIYEVTGVNFAKAIATFVLNLISGDETEADLSQAQSKFDERYDAAISEQYEAWKKNQEESGQEAMSFEEFKASDLAMSRSDFNLETNKTLGKRIFDGSKKLGRGIVSTGKKLTEVYLPHKESVYTAPDGTYYRKTLVGDYYDYYSPTGAMIATQISTEEVMQKLKQGELSETEKWTTPKRFQKYHELGKIIQNSFTDSWQLTTKSFGVMMDIVKSSKDYWAENIKEHGLFGAVKNAFTKKVKKGWFDMNGGYYVLNDEGTAYNYYNANGDLVSEDVDKDEVEEMKLNGLLTESDVVEDSDAQKAVKDIKGKVADLWKDAKSNAGRVLDSVAEFLGLKRDKLDEEDKQKESAKATTTTTTSTEKTESATTKKTPASSYAASNNSASVQAPSMTPASSYAAASSDPMNLQNIVSNAGGKGSNDSETTSSSGVVNGFSYYSQNDPRFRDHSYNLSNGSGGTMGERGCGPAAMSMVASQLTGEDIDPVTMANAATRGGYSISEGTTPEYFGDTASKLGLHSESATPSREAITSMLNSGKPVIIQGRDSREGSPFTGSGHYVVGVGMNGNNVIVNDPRGREYSKQYSLDDVVSGAQNLWGFSKGSGSTGSSLNPLAARGDGVEGDILNNFPYLLQGDDRWGATPYSATGNPKQTIASSACGPTSMAMVLRSFGNNVTPIDTASYSLKNGYRTENSGTSWGFFPSIGSQYGVSTTELGKDANQAVSEVQKGNPVIASMGPGTFTKGGHYIVLSGATEDGKIMVNDPAKVARSNVPYDPSVFAKEGKQFWAFSKDGKGSINNVADVGNITPEALKAGTPMATKDKLAAKVTEGTPDSGTVSGAKADEIDTSITGETQSNGEETGATSILEMLTGAVSAITKPILDWLRGGSSSASEGNATTPEEYKSGTAMMKTGGASAPGSSINAASDISGSSTAEKAWNYYTGVGLSKEATSAVLGNADAESGLNPGVIQGNGKGPAAGFFQWENYNNKSGRWKAMADYASSKGKDWTDLQSQLEFGHKEMMDPGSVFWKSDKNMAKVGAVPTTYEEWSKSSDVDMATRQFEAAFERAGKPNMERRISAAKKFYEIYKDKDQGNLTPESYKSGTNATPIASGLSNKNSNLVQAAGKGGSLVTSVQDSNRYTSIDHVSNDGVRQSSKLDESTIPLLKAVVELLTRITDNTSGINDGVKELYGKEFPTSTQIVDGGTHNNIIPVPQQQKGNDTPKDMNKYQMAKQISAGKYLS